MDQQILKINEAAKFIGKSVTTVRRLCDQKKLGFYGDKFEKKTFSVEEHLKPYMLRIEKKPVETVSEEKKGRRTDYQYRTNLFNGLKKF